MITSPQHIDIGWPLKALFHYIADIENNSQWHSEVIHAEWITRTEERIGCTYKEVKKINEEETDVVFTVSEFIPYQKRTVTFANAISVTIQFEFLTEEWTRLYPSVNQPGNNSVHLSCLFLNDLNKLKNMLEEVYC